MSGAVDLIKDLIVTPKEAGDLAHRYVERIIDDRKRGVIGIPSALRELDKHLNPLKEGQMRVVMGRPSHGKCHGRGTRVVMYDGSLRNIEDVAVGDLVMGVDSTARTVVATTSGVDRLYKIKQYKGVDYTVTPNHILALKRSKNEKLRKHGEIRLFMAEDLYHRKKTISPRWKGFAVGVEMQEKSVPVDPYLLGVWLGDGNSKDPQITKPDIELYDRVCEIAATSGWEVSVRNGTKCFTYYIKGVGKNEKRLKDLLSELGVLGNKHIPFCYLSNSRQNRLQLLAGLLDTDGYLSQGKQYEICQKSKRLIDDICFLANSLGFRCTYSEKIVNGVIYYRATITGDIWLIPLCIQRKIARKFETSNDQSMTAVDIEYIGIGDYFGIELDGDRLYLLEDFTVTHNSALMMHFARVGSEQWAAKEKKDRTPPIVVSAEMAIEEIVLREISHYIPVDSIQLERGEYDEWNRVHDTIDNMTEECPIIYIGHSLEQGRKRPRLSVENIWRSLDYLTDTYGMSPSLVSVDYAQRLRLDKVTRDRRLEVSEIVEMIKDMALAFVTPVVLGSQVGRQVDSRNPPIPEIQDAKETANLEETADSVISVFRPIKHYKEGELIPGTALNCVPELFFVNILKQRQGVSGKGVWCWFDMSITRIADLEVDRIELNNF